MSRAGRPRKVGEPGVHTTLTLKARDLPIDDALRNALPAPARATLDRFGIGGTVDITGPIAVLDPRADPEFDFTIVARDGRFAPTDWKTSIDKIDATLQVTPRLVRVDRATGERGGAKVSASGSIDLADPSKPTLTLEANAVAMAFDATLRDSLPAPAQKVWDTLRPSGTADGMLKLTGSAESPDWVIDLTARGDAALDKPEFLPIAMTNLTGSVHAIADRVEINSVTAKVAGGTATLTGVGEFKDRSSWTLKLQTNDTLVDAILLDALPAAMSAPLKENAVAGRTDLDFQRLDWTHLAGREVERHRLRCRRDAAGFLVANGYRL